MGLLHISLFISALSAGLVSATTVTLYDVVAPQPTDTDIPGFSADLSRVISAIGVGADGKTTYAEQWDVTKMVIDYSTTTSTIVPTFLPIPVTDTFAEDASGIVRVYTLNNEQDGLGPAPTMISQSCGFQGTTAGSCVGVIEFATNALEDIKSIVTTYTGPLTPLYTLTETASVPGQTQSSGAFVGNDWRVWQLIGLVFSVGLVFW